MNNKIYLGASLDMKKRWSCHRALLRSGKHKNPHLQSSWKKYGEKSFEFELLLICREKQLPRLEQLLLDKMKLDYNIAINAENAMRGRPRTAESKLRMSISNRGQIPWIKGKHHTRETKEKIRKALVGNSNHLGHKASGRSREKMSAAQKRRWQRCKNRTI